MTPATYNVTRQRLNLTHEALAQLLGIEPQTSRVWSLRTRSGPDDRAVITLKLIEALGVDEARRIIGETTMNELVIALTPNLGWTVTKWIDGECEGPTHNGFFPSKKEAREEAERIAPKYDARIVIR